MARSTSRSSEWTAPVAEELEPLPLVRQSQAAIVKEAVSTLTPQTAYRQAMAPWAQRRTTHRRRGPHVEL